MNDALNSENKRLIEKTNLMKIDKNKEQQCLEQKKQINNLNILLESLKDSLSCEKCAFEAQLNDLEKKHQFEISNSKQIAKDLFNTKLQLQTSNSDLASLQLKELSADKEQQRLKSLNDDLVNENKRLI